MRNPASRAVATPKTRWQISTTVEEPSAIRATYRARKENGCDTKLEAGSAWLALAAIHGCDGRKSKRDMRTQDISSLAVKWSPHKLGVCGMETVKLEMPRILASLETMMMMFRQC